MPKTITLNFNNPHAVPCHGDPELYYQDNFISPVECRYIIDMARDKLQRAKVSLDEESSIIEGRSGSNCWLAYDSDETLMSIGKRIADHVGLPLANAESIQVVHYGSTQEYRPHFDAYDLGTARGKRCCKYGGQRLVTALVYLNDVAAGGETGFPKLGIDVKPSPGRMVVFRNTDTDTNKPHPLSLHAGKPVLEGEKWAFNMWFHAEPVRQVVDFDNYTSPTVRVGDGAASRAAAVNGKLAVEAPMFSVITNRAQQIFTGARVKLGPMVTNLKQRTCLTYWDTYGNSYPDLGEIPPGTRILSLISRSIMNPFADKKRMPGLFAQHGLAHLVPETYDDPLEAARQSPGDDTIWFVKHIHGTSGKGMFCVKGRDLPALKLEKHQIVQKGITNLALVNGRKFTTRVYLLIWKQKLFLYKEGFLVIHGVDYDPDSTDYQVQIDHSGYNSSASPVSMALFSELERYPAFIEQCRTLAASMKKPLSAALIASSNDTYSVLGIDLMLQANGNVKLIEINIMPNFIHTDRINDRVNIPFFADVMSIMLGQDPDKLIAC